MRTPKYKAFYKPHNYIYHVTDMNFEGPDYTLREVKLSNGIWVRSDKLDDVILIEQTPFTDKNGEKIYEGDVIGDWAEIDGKMEQSRLTVHFDEMLGEWKLYISFNQDRTSSCSLFSELQYFEYEVLGNIYENPELISKTPTHEH